MITQQAREALRQVLNSGLRDTLAQDEGWQIEPVTPNLLEPQPQFVMLTISHFAFRLVVCLHFDTDSETRRFIADRMRIAADRVGEADFRDAVCEIGNELCGVMKRMLNRSYAHLGMSTPHLLERRSLPHVLGQTGQIVVGARVGDGDRTLFRCSLIAHPYAEMDFQLLEEPAPSAASGELELF